MTGAMTALWSSPERRSERCATCDGERLFEQPPCFDGHEPGECPDWACAECGHAITLGSAEPTRPVRQLVTAAA
jgi:hypothetical protein